MPVFHQNLRKGKVMSIITIGIDLAKHVFATHGVNESAKSVLNDQLGCARARIQDKRECFVVFDKFIFAVHVSLDVLRKCACQLLFQRTIRLGSLGT